MKYKIIAEELFSLIKEIISSESSVPCFSDYGHRSTILGKETLEFMVKKETLGFMVKMDEKVK